MDSPEALVSTFNPLGLWSVLPPQLVQTTGGNASNAYNELNDDFKNQLMILQVHSTTAVKFAFNQDASAGNYHGIIKGASGANNGDPDAILVLNREQLSAIRRISLFCASDYVVSVIRFVK